MAEQRSAERLASRLVAVVGRASDRATWRLDPRSRPRKDGTRHITLIARSQAKALNIEMTASEAAELMFAIGAALEQAVRDERGAALDLTSRPAALDGHA